MSETTKAEKASPSPTQSILLNNQARLELVQRPGTPDMLTIMPGLNLLDTALLKELRSNPAFEAKFKAKIKPSNAEEARYLRVGEPFLEEGPVVPAVAPLSKLPDAEVRELVGRICDEVLLDQLLSTEGRSEIRAVMETRRRFLQTGQETGAPAGDAA